MNEMTTAMLDESKRLHEAQMLAHYQRLYFESLREVRACNKGVARLRRKLDRTRREAADAAAYAGHTVRMAEGDDNLDRLKWALFGAAAGIALYKLFA